MLDMELADQLVGDIDPADRALIAHETAAAIVGQARESNDPELIARLVRLVDEEGVDTVAMMWSKADAHTLPGALWRLYMLREWVAHDADAVARSYHEGVHAAHVRHAIAGVEDPPGPDEMRQACRHDSARGVRGRPRRCARQGRRVLPRGRYRRGLRGGYG